MPILVFYICTLLQGSKPYLIEKRIGNYEQFQTSQLTALKNKDFFLLKTEMLNIRSHVCFLNTSHTMYS